MFHHPHPSPRVTAVAGIYPSCLRENICVYSAKVNNFITGPLTDKQLLTLTPTGSLDHFEL